MIRARAILLVCGCIATSALVVLAVALLTHGWGGQQSRTLFTGQRCYYASARDDWTKIGQVDGFAEAPSEYTETYHWFNAFVQLPDPTGPGTRRLCGALLTIDVQLGAVRIRGFAVPNWVLVFVCIAACAITMRPVAIAMRRRLRVRRGHCQSCAYDLTANTSGRCPECGLPVPGRTDVPGRA